MLIALLILVIILLAALVILRVANPLPKAHRQRAPNHADESTSEIAKLYGAQAKKLRKRSGLYPIADGQEALALRLALTKLATQTIHSQYYIWDDDLSGLLLLAALIDAADRGVKVRLIIDDNTTAGSEAMWAAAQQHPNITLKFFNPFRIRKFRTINYFIDFMRLNRRMHNKSFVVDGQAAIVGGRNVGDNYFSAHLGPHFTDMDVLALGEVVPHVAKAFDAYWTCASAYDAAYFLQHKKGATLAALRHRIAERRESAAGEALAKDMTKFASAGQLEEGKLPLEWAPARLLVDDPKKGLGKVADSDLVVGKLGVILAHGRKELKIASAYFVPGKRGTKFLQKLSGRGLNIQILTNSLASNNLISVHAGYARYRKKLLRAKLELFELKANRRILAENEKQTRSPKKFFGASSSTLHAKVFILDRQKVFISSFNFDPRSTFLNCEMGILMESAALARYQLKQVESKLRRNSYRLELLDGHRLIWLDLQHHHIGVISREPETSLGRRVIVWLISKLPLEWML